MATTTATGTTTNGRVKWFNTKAGYGFITLVDAVTNEERDVFVHHSEIQVAQSQYKYLVQGEYVDCVLASIEKDGHSEHATQVSGVKGGKLMCETRNEARANRTPTQHARDFDARAPQQRAPQQRAQQQSTQQQRARKESRPQLNPADEGEWMIVRRRTTTTNNNTSTSTSTSTSTTPKKQANRPPRQRQPGIEIE